MCAIKVLVTNQKGGVGKSTIAVNLAAYIAIQKRMRVNLIDFDHQGSSSSWINSAPDVGLVAHHAVLDSKCAGQFLLSQARRNLDKFSADCDLSVSDVTWTHALPLEFMLQFDAVIIPTSDSKYELASTLDFLVKYTKTNFFKGKKIPLQKIIIAPNRISGTMSADKFFELESFERCSIAPPLQFIAKVDEFVCQDYLCVANNSDAAENFSCFGQQVTKLIFDFSREAPCPSLQTHHCRANNISFLDKYRSNLQSQAPRYAEFNAPVIPNFLMK